MYYILDSKFNYSFTPGVEKPHTLENNIQILSTV